jgi:hypothetical protein
VGKTSTSREININREPSLARIKIDGLHKSWGLDAKRLPQTIDLP